MTTYLPIILSITTAGLYTLGFTYHQGYLREFGINDSLFPLSVDRTLFEGFVSLSSMGATAVVWFVLAAEGVLLLAVAGTFVLKLATKKKWLRNSRIQKINVSPDNNTEDEDGHNFIMFSKTMLICSLVLFFMLIGILFVLIASDKSGTESAKRFRENAQKGNIKSSRVVFKNNNAELEGTLIAASQTNVALFLTNKVVVFNMSDIVRIDSR